MTTSILLCTDGSEVSLDALASGLELLGRDHHYLLVTVVDAPDPEVLSGTGHAGAEMSAEEFDLAVGSAHESARQVLGEAEARLDSGLTHEEMAQMIGSSRETVTRLLGELRRKSLIRRDGAGLIIQDRRALEAMAS